VIDVMPAPKPLGKKRRFGPTLEDNDDDDDDGKPAAKPAAKKCRALCSSDSASERPLESGHPVLEGPVPPVAAMPPEAAQAAAPKRGHPAGSRNKRTPQKGAKRQVKQEAVTRRVMMRSPTFLWIVAITAMWSFLHTCTHLSLSWRYSIVCKRGTWTI